MGAYCNVSAQCFTWFCTTSRCSFRNQIMCKLGESGKTGNGIENAEIIIRVMTAFLLLLLFIVDY